MELVKIEKKEVVKAFESGECYKVVVDAAKTEVDKFEHDLSTSAGRKRTASLANKVAKLKTAIDGIGKDLVSDWKQQAKVVDQERKRIRDALDDLKSDARSPLTEWETNEAKRVQSHKDAICHLRGMDRIGETSNSIMEVLKSIELIDIDDNWEEFQDEAKEVKAESIRQLTEAYNKALTIEKQAEELERMKAEQEAREKAEKVAKDLKESLEKELLEAKVRAELAEKRMEEEVKQAKEKEIQAEKERQAKAEQEAKAKEDEERARLANVKHVSGIRTAAKEAIMLLGVEEETAKGIVKAIHNNKIPNVTINY